MKSDWNYLNIHGITLKIMDLCFYKKQICHQMMNKNKKTILGLLYFFHTRKAVLVVW